MSILESFWSLGISKLNDEGYLKKLAESRRAITGRDSKKPHKQLHLFCGPPATGKTMAMKILAAEGGLSARLFLNLKVKKNYVLLQWMGCFCEDCFLPERSQSISADVERAWLRHIEGNARRFEEDRWVTWLFLVLFVLAPFWSDF